MGRDWPFGWSRPDFFPGLSSFFPAGQFFPSQSGFFLASLGQNNGLAGILTKIGAGAVV
jgi:hypothetical protein